MTNAIEQAKREMYEAIAKIKLGAYEAMGGIHYAIGSAKLDRLESSLESYLELLRQDHEALHETARKRFEDIRNLWTANDDLAQRLAKMTEERDSIQLRMHAVDHAYNEQQSRGATLVSNSGESPSCATLDGKTAAILGAVVDCQRIVTDWSLEGLKAKEAMRLIFFVVMSPTINSALYEFESKK